METKSDKLRAVGLALGVHALIVALLCIGLLRQPVAPQRSPNEPIIEATLISLPQLSSATANEIKASGSNAAISANQHAMPLPEPLPTDTITPLPKPDMVDQEMERLKNQPVEKKQVQGKMASLAPNDATASPSPSFAKSDPTTKANGGQEELLAKYQQAMSLAANSNWVHADVPEQIHCRIRFTQIPGGEVIAVQFLDCPLDAAGRDSVDRAIRKTQLPYSGFESVFLRQWEMDFCVDRKSLTTNQE